MSKITRDELFKFLTSEDFVPASSLDKIMERIEQREDKFAEELEEYSIELKNMYERREAELAELVEAALTLSRTMDDVWNHSSYKYKDKEIEAAQQVVKTFLPPPSPADRLDALIKDATYIDRFKLKEELISIRAELREDENEHAM